MGDLQLNATLRAFENYSTGNCSFESLQGKIAAAKAQEAGNAKGAGAVNIAPVTGEDGAPPQNIRRDPKMKPNNRVRKEFFEGIARQFGGLDKIPQRVIEAMKLEDYGGLKMDKDGKGVVAAEHCFTSNKKLSDTRVKAVLDAVRIELAQKRGQKAFTKLCAQLGSVGKAGVSKVLKDFLVEILLPEEEHKVANEDWVRGNNTLEKAVDSLRKAYGSSNSLLIEEDQEPGKLPVDDPVKKVDFMRALKKLSEITTLFFKFKCQDPEPGRKEQCDLAVKSFLDKAEADLKWSPVDAGELLKQQYGEKNSDEEKGDFLCNLFCETFDEQDTKTEGAIDSKVREKLLKLIQDEKLEIVGKLQNPACKEQMAEWLKARFRECAELTLMTDRSRNQIEDIFNCFMDRTFGIDKHVISDRRMNLFKSIAALARGKDEGTDGGAGYMGYIAGKPVKFLTHASERFGSMSSGLTKEQIALVNQSTVALVQKLKILASFSNPKVQAAVNKLLLPHEGKVGTGKLIPPLPRTTVAEIVSLIAPEVRDSRGVGLHWVDVRHAATQGDTKIATVFTDDMLELEPTAWKAANNEWNSEKARQHFIATLENESYLSLVEAEWEDYEFVGNVGNLATPPKATANEKRMVADIKKRMMDEGFVNKDGGNLLVFNGDSQTAALAFERLFPGMGGYALHTFADATYGAGTLGKEGGQEESLFLDSDPAPYAAMIKKGLLKLVNVVKNGKPQTRLQYVLDPEKHSPKASTVSGVLIKHDLHVTPPADNKVAEVKKGNKANADEKVNLGKVTLNASRLLTAWPSFQIHHYSSDDIFGDAGWAIKCVENLAGRTVTEDESNNAIQFFTELIANTSEETRKANGFGKCSKADTAKVNSVSPTRARDALMMAMFLASMKNPPFDVFGGDSKREVGKLLDLINKDDYKELFDQARQNYIETTKAVLRKHLDGLLAKNIHVLLGGAIGCGVFGNIPGDVAKVFNEVLAEDRYKDSVLYVYCKRRGDEKTYTVFKNAFNAGGGAGATASPLLAENGSQSNVKVGSAPKAVNESKVSQSKVRMGRKLELPKNIEKLIGEQFPKVGPLYKNILREIAAKDPAHAQKILTKLSKVEESGNAVAQIFLNQPNTDARLKLLDWLGQFENSTSNDLPMLTRALSSRRDELLAAEDRNGGKPLSRAEMLAILFPYAKKEIEANAEVVKANPKKCFGKVFDAACDRIEKELFTLPRDTGALFEFQSNGRMLVAAGVPLDEIREMLKGGKLPEPAKWDKTAFLCSTSKKDGLDGLMDAFARDFWGQKPTVSMCVRSTGADQPSEEKTWDPEALYNAGMLQSSSRSPTSDEVVNNVLTLCEGNELQTMNVVMALTQSNMLEPIIRSVMPHETPLKSSYKIDIVKNPETGDVTVTKASKPGSAIISSVTRIFHPDGTMTVIPPGKPKLNEEYLSHR